MQYCVDFNKRVVEVLNFSRDRNEKFLQHPKCYSKTKYRKIDEKELSFGEILEETINRVKGKEK